MKHSKLRLFRYLAPDAKAMEAELDRMARLGWALRWLHCGLACFRRTQRRDLSYCVELCPVNRAGEEDAGYLRLCADAGWELRAQSAGFRVFASYPGACPAPLQTDPALDFEVNWKTVLRQAQWNFLHLPFVLAFNLLLGLFTAARPIHWWGVFLSLPHLLLLPCLLLVLLWDTASFLWLGAFRRRCRGAAGSGAPLPVPSRRVARGRMLCSTLASLLLLLSLLLTFWPSPGRINDLVYPADLYPVVRSGDLSGGAEDTGSGYLLWEGSPLLCHAQSLTFLAHTPVRTDYYLCRWGWLADAVRDSLLAEEQSENAPHFHAAPIHPEPIELGFDRSWLYIGPDGWQSLLLVEGNVVASVEGPADFTDPAVLDMVRARLELEKSPDPAPEARPVGMSAPVKQAQGVEGFHA